MKIGKSSRIKLTYKISIALVILAIIEAGVYVAYSNYQTSVSIESQKRIENEKLATAKAIIAAREAKKKEPVYISLPGAQKIRAIVQDYTLNDSLWAIASKTHALSIDYVPSPISIPNVETRTDKSADEQSVRTDIVNDLEKMFAQAKTDGHNVMIGSGYRSAALQTLYYNNAVNSSGVDVANQYVALPGKSEHQTGLAVDISTSSRECYLDRCFATTSDGLWLAENAYKYGFILRYPEGKESITGYNYEPWHFRYVGVDLATALYESKLTLDEAWPYLEKALETLKNNCAIE